MWWTTFPRVTLLFAAIAGHSSAVTSGGTAAGDSDTNFEHSCASAPASAQRASSFQRPNACNIERVAAADMPVERFVEEFQNIKPVIVTHDSPAYQQQFAAQTARTALLREWGDQLVTLGTANTHTGQTTRQTTMREYLDYVDSTDFTSIVGNETWYLFGDQVENFWDDFLAAYRWPPMSAALKALDPLGYHQTAAFGIGGVASGVPFHTHGEGWSEVIHGAKHWYLFDLTIGNTYPQDDRDQSQWDWTLNRYPNLSDEQEKGLYECTIVPGEALYFPAHWFHATLNVDPYTCFVSAFT